MGDRDSTSYGAVVAAAKEKDGEDYVVEKEEVSDIYKSGLERI